jgi:FkbM family methyltransferase
MSTDFVDVYGRQNYHNFMNYKGTVENDNKYKNYKYCISVENNSEYNYATEKIWEPVLCECLCFYWGCPNIGDYIDARAFVLLDLNDYEKSCETIKRAIEEDWWSERIDIIRKEKEKILNELAFFPTLDRIIQSSGTFYSQDSQDLFLEKTIFRGYKNGFFVDVGAHDGVSINNTLHFEKYNNWKGINIEPIKKVYDKLVNNRPNNINLNLAVCNNDGETEFICNTGYTEMISGIKDNFDSRHWQRLQNENKIMGSTTEIIKVNTKKLETICDEYNISHINYLSIDVEGAEFEVIQSINFDKVFIDVIGFENNYDDNSIPIIKYLEDNNFVMIHKSLDIFMIHRKSIFYK